MWTHRAARNVMFDLEGTPGIGGSSIVLIMSSIYWGMPSFIASLCFSPFAWVGRTYTKIFALVARKSWNDRVSKEVAEVERRLTYMR